MNVLGGGSLTIAGCVFAGNESPKNGGAVQFHQVYGLAAIEDTVFTDNASAYGGGGTIHAALNYPGTALRLERVIITGSSAYIHNAAAIDITKNGITNTAVEMTNVILASNTALPSAGTYDHPVIGVNNGTSAEISLTAKHVTWADHPDLSALRLESTGAGGAARAFLTNVLVDSAEDAFAGAEVGGGTVAIEHTKTLTYNVTNVNEPEEGTPDFTEVDPVTGDPMLDANSRLQGGSAAIDAGVDAGVTDDVDGQARPAGSGYDIGADEYSGFIFADGFEDGNTLAWSDSVGELF